MAFNTEIFALLFSLLATLVFPASVRAEPALSSYRPLAQEVFYPVWALERHELTRSAVASLVVGDETLAIVAVYDDPTTVRRVDYLELYDDAGRLLAASWFDRFGIERVAADRGFVEGKNDLEGVFVILLDGDSV